MDVTPITSEGKIIKDVSGERYGVVCFSCSYVLRGFSHVLTRNQCLVGVRQTSPEELAKLLVLTLNHHRSVGAQAVRKPL